MLDTHVVVFSQQTPHNGARNSKRDLEYFSRLQLFIRDWRRSISEMNFIITAPSGIALDACYGNGNIQQLHKLFLSARKSKNDSVCCFARVLERQVVNYAREA